GGGFSRPGFADDSQPLAPQREAGIAHRARDARPPRKRDVQVFDSEKGGAHDDFGSNTSRNPSPSRLKPRLTMKIAMPGMVATHHWSRITSRPAETMAPHSA